MFPLTVIPQEEISDLHTSPVSVGSSVESPTAGPIRRRGPSKRRRPPSSLASDTPKVPRIVSASSNFDGNSTTEMGLLDTILCSVAKTHSMIPKSKELVELTSIHTDKEMEKQRVVDFLTRSEDVNPNAVCINCGETDTSKIEESADKSGMSCNSCGAIVSTNFAQSPFERVQRFDMPSEDSIQRLNNRNAGDGVQSSRERANLRLASVTSTKVVRNHQGAQTKINREVSRSTHTDMVYLNHAQDLRRQRAMVEVHKMISGIGRDPDSCPIFDKATRMINNAFEAAGAHAMLCNKDTSSSVDACPALILNASHSSVASEAVRSAMEELIAMEAEHETDLGSQSASVRQARVLLSPVISKYVAAVHVSGPLQKRFHSLIHNKRALGKPCKNMVAGGVPSSSTHGATQSVSTGIARTVKISIESLVSLGWINTSTARVATSFCASAEFVQWVNPLSAWPSDILALIIACSATKGDKTTLNAHMARLAKTERINLQTIEENMVDSLLYKYETTTDDPWS